MFHNNLPIWSMSRGHNCDIIINTDILHNILVKQGIYCIDEHKFFYIFINTGWKLGFQINFKDPSYFYSEKLYDLKVSANCVREARKDFTEINILWP